MEKLIDTQTAKSIGRRIKSARMLAGLSRDEFEQASSISRHTLQAWELGKNKLSQKGAEKIVATLYENAINCDSNWLLYGEGNNPLQVKNNLTISTPMLAQNIINLDIETAIQAEIAAFTQYNSQAIVSIVTDDGMAPRYKIGDYIGGYKLSEEEFNVALDYNCIIETDEGTFFRKFKRSKQGYMLFCLNQESKLLPIIIPNKLISVAPVVWHRWKFV